MADLNLGGPDLVELVDARDCTRHILGQLQIPTTSDQITRALRAYKASGMSARLPAPPDGSGRMHIDVCDVQGTLDALVEHGLAVIVKGKTFEAIAEKARSLKATVNHLVEDGTDRLDGWVSNMDKAGEDPDADYYNMTHDGFWALTGHKQFERPENEPEEPVDPADVQPATIGA